MPYTTPTAADLKARFPEFADVDNAIVTTFISAAANDISPNQWIERNYQTAIIYLAAHYMWLYQQQLLINAQSVSGGGGSSGAEDTPVATYLSMMKWEDFEIDFRSANTSKTGGQSSSFSQVMGGVSPLYGRTIYGQLYIDLRRRNLPMVVLIP